ncbi:hypothetical protein QJQ45_016795 [Haematococcus lacustris]|nr:hypothetical protein QJQ45_016795 [Haematococcus lacustris]
MADMRALSEQDQQQLQAHLEVYYLACPISNAPVESLLQLLKHGTGMFMELPDLLELMSMRTRIDAIDGVDVLDFAQRLPELGGSARHVNGSALRDGPFKCCFTTPTTQDAEFSAAVHCAKLGAMQVKAELATVDKANTVTESLARVNFHPECEAAINEQINIEYAISYVYHSLYAYFDRDNVGLPGFAKYFKAASDEEREHAELLMQYQNKRGGRVKLSGIMTPEMEFAHHDKGEALYAMELALAMEKLNFQKLRELHDVADKHGDASFADFVEGQLLADQVESVKKAAEQVSQLRRVGQGLGVYLYDKELGA